MKSITAIIFVILISVGVFAQTSTKVQMFPYVDNTGRDVCLAWNTETGKSVFYAWNTSVNNWKAYSINLPESPLEGATGSIMMLPYVDNTGRDVCLVWDTGTGKSVFYSWDTSINNWKAYSINLPETPLEGALGSIMMNAYVDNTGRDVCLVWDTSNGKSVFYAWNTSINNWKAYSINIPESPVE